MLGAGKTTLLNVLAGRIGEGELSGTVRLNNKLRNPATWKTDCAYVEQDDLMFQHLTVQETITYSALLRLPNSMTRDEKHDKVNDIIMDLGLNGCRNTYVGGSSLRGISGGERKRVSVGTELVTSPDVLFLDEPTSGLDSFTAFNLIDTLKQLAVKKNKIVILTIHQPRTDILALFDRVLLLSVGKLVWNGPTSDAIQHFEALGFPLPENTNPSDHFLDIITLDQRSETLKEQSLQRITMFHNKWEEVEANVLGNLPDVTSSDVSKSKGKFVDCLGGFKATWATEFFTLLHRNMRETLRDVPTLIATVAQSIVLMVGRFRNVSILVYLWVFVDSSRVHLLQIWIRLPWCSESNWSALLYGYQLDI
jgi:ABC-type multidrug transport system ATPase subunit